MSGPHSGNTNQEALEELAWSIEMSQGQFKLLLARCNYTHLQTQIAEQLQAICPIPIHRVTLPATATTLYTSLKAALGDAQPAAVMVFGLETVRDRDLLFSSTNQVREEFRQTFPFPLVLWINDENLRYLLRLAPDFYSWSTTTPFSLPTPELHTCLRHAAHTLFATILTPDSRLSFSRLLTDLNFGSLHRQELVAAMQDLQQRGEALEPEVQASLDFFRGLEVGVTLTGLNDLQQSLQRWQHQGDRSQLTSDQSADLKQALLHFYIGRYQAYLTLPGERSPDLLTAKQSFETAIALFEQANRPDLLSKCVNHLARILEQLQAWDALEALIQPAIALHQTYGTIGRLAQTYHYLTQVALQRQQGELAMQYACHAWEALKQSPSDQRWRGLYLMNLARAERLLGNRAKAIALLESAQNLGDQGLPRVFGLILEERRQIHLEQKQYLEAFHLKQARLSLEQQYGIRAFIGAGRLKPQREDEEPIVIQRDRPLSLEEIAPEIRASGRQKDLQELLSRIGRHDYKLLVVHGHSGVGKSSLVTAGLVPALKQKAIGVQDNIPVLIRKYSHWREELERRLKRALADREVAINDRDAAFGPERIVDPSSLLPNATPLPGMMVGGPMPLAGDRSPTNSQDSSSDLDDLAAGAIASSSNLQSSPSHPPLSPSDLQPSPSDLHPSPSDLHPLPSHPPLHPPPPLPHPTPHTPHSTPLLPLLRHNEANNLRTVLIFDQFEEFFFAHPDPLQRRAFFEFLGDCLENLSIKVILSLRIDYLHYLLECSTLPTIVATGIDILSRQVLYPLGNFAPADARAIIHDLTERAGFYLDADLIDTLVNDLAGELQEVRPIELQIVGAQLQEDNITTLAAYRTYGDHPKLELVRRYLAAAIADCGPENQRLTELILYLLTDEKGTRPLKTRPELERDLEALATDTIPPATLDLVLRILVDSGLVVLLPEIPEDRYQLVHDYIAEFIRQQQAPQLAQLIAELHQERRQRLEAEAQRQLTEKTLHQEQQAKQVLEQAYQEAAATNRRVRQRIRVGSVALLISVVISVALLGITGLLIFTIISNYCFQPAPPSRTSR
jgi:tetratricopeptide (TPR) repeat protein